jgi:hypothetical protein
VITLPVSLLLLALIPALISRSALPLAKGIEKKESEYTRIVDSAVHGVVEARIYGYLEQSFIPAQQHEIVIGKKERSLIFRSGLFSLNVLSLQPYAGSQSSRCSDRYVDLSSVGYV